jgi:hypothetical protein
MAWSAVMGGMAGRGAGWVGVWARSAVLVRRRIVDENALRWMDMVPNLNREGVERRITLLGVGAGLVG